MNDLRSRLKARLTVWISLLALAGVAFGTGLALFNNLLMPRFIHGTGEVRVPDLANLTVDQAEQALRAANLKLVRAGERFDPSVPRGFILAQDPPADTPILARRMVAVTVSLGEEFSTVPELFGSTVRGASVLIARAGLEMRGVTRAPSDEVGEGLVVASDPPAEAVLPHNASVALLVSAGAGEDSYVMPDLLGRDVELARRDLESLGFRVLSPENQTRGTIFAQDPAAGSRILRGATLMVQASGGVRR